MAFPCFKNCLFTMLMALALAACQAKVVITGKLNFSNPSFAGVSDVFNNNNGTYTVSWPAATNAKNVTYQIFAREVPSLSLLDTFYGLFTSSTNDYFSTPTATVSGKTEWITGVLAFKDNTCFVVRAEAKNLTDNNLVEVCTKQTKYQFLGLNNLVDNKNGTFTLAWTAVPYVTTAYNIYQRSEASGVYDFTVPTVANLGEVSWTSGILSALGSQCFVVRAVPVSQEFTDSNTNEICTKQAQVAFATITNLTAISTSNTTERLEWTPSYASSDGYKVAYAQGDNAPADCLSGTVLSAEKITGTVANISELSTNTKYSARVCAVNSDITPDTSLGEVITFTTTNTNITEVSSLTASAVGDTAINLSWTYAGNDSPTFSVSYGVGTAAPVVCGAGTTVNSSYINSTSAQITGLNTNTTYSFRVCTAANGATMLSTGVTTSATTSLNSQAAPPNVTSLSTIILNSNNILLSWTSGGGNTVGYNITYAVGATAPATCATGTAIASGNINTSTALASGLAAGTQYSFRVCAINGNTIPDVASGTTTSGTTAFAAAPNVTNLTATPTGSTAVLLSWTSGGGTTTGYKVSYLLGATPPTSCATDTILPNGQISGTIATVSGLTANSQYSFRVCSLNGNATPDASSGTSATSTTLQTAPPNATSLLVIPTSDTNISLAWTGGGGSTAGYKVSYASGVTSPATCALGTLLPGGQISGTTASVSGLTANTQYSFRVCAVNTNSTPDVSSGITVSGTTLNAAPADLSASSGSNLATLSWSTVSGASNYVIYYSTSASVTKAATRVVVAAPSYQVTGLASSTTYYFNIALIVGGTESDLAATEVSATTYPTPPSAPGGVYLSFAYNKALQLHFNTVSGAVSYKAYYKTAAGVTTSDTLVAGVSEGYIISGLNTVGTYYVKVSAVDAYGQESSLSAEASYRLYEYSLIPQNNASYNQLPISKISRTYASGSTIYAATQLGVSISTNAGSTWVNKNVAHGLASNSVSSVYAIGSNIYAATAGGGISISTNAGLTWLNKSTASGLASNDARDIYVDNTNIYVATYDGGLSLSTDNGVTWSNKTTVAGLGSNDIRRMVVSGTNIYAATAAGVAISTDNGATWVNKTTANGLGGDDVSAISMAGSTIYAATIGGLSVSTNAGTNWTTTTTACGIATSNMHSLYAAGNNVYLALGGGTVGACISTDSGSTWTAKTTASGLGGYFAVDFYANGGNVYASFDGTYNYEVGLSISTNNGSTWTHTMPIVPSDIRHMVVTGTSIYAATDFAGLYISTNSGATWINKTTANGLGSNFTRVVYVSGSNIYVANSGISISTNGGSTWVTKTSANGLGNNYIEDICADGTNIYAASTSGLSISTNGGTNWLNKTSAHGLAATSISSVFAVGSNIYAGTNGSGLSISTNGGTTWATKNTFNGIGDNRITNIYKDGTSIYLATDNGVSISTDSGTTWVNKVSNDFPDDYINSIIASNGSIYATTNYGIKISTDNGTSWLRKEETTYFDWINWLALSGTSVYLAGYSGIYASDL